MTKSKIKTPLLRPGSYSVMMAETKTGIVLTLDGAYHAGTGDVFRIFDSLTEAKAFCEKRTYESTEFEYMIHDWKGKRIDYFKPYDLENNGNG